MKLKKTGIMTLVGGFVVLLVVATIIGLSVYSGSNTSRVGLLVSYFRALAADDRVGLDELTAPGFFSDLLLPSLEPGSYELFDFGETGEADSIVQRFLLIVDSGTEGKSAYLADMEYQRKLLGTDILAIRSIGKGLPVKP